GREEDAADAYATVTMLKFGSSFSNRVLVEAAKGWFLSAERNDRRGNMLSFYDEHGLDWQRAYQIICLMVGSDADQFKQLADWVQMPEDRQDSCGGDYSNASWSWDMVLKSHRRAGDQSKTKIDVVYGEGKGRLAIFERAFRAVGLLEAVAEFNADNYAGARPRAAAFQEKVAPGAARPPNPAAGCDDFSLNCRRTLTAGAKRFSLRINMQLKDRLATLHARSRRRRRRGKSWAPGGLDFIPATWPRTCVRR